MCVCACVCACVCVYVSARAHACVVVQKLWKHLKEADVIFLRSTYGTTDEINIINSAIVVRKDIVILNSLEKFEMQQTKRNGAAQKYEACLCSLLSLYIILWYFSHCVLCKFKHSLHALSSTCLFHKNRL